MNRLFILGLVLLLPATVLRGQTNAPPPAPEPAAAPAPPRIAIIGDADSQDLAALVTTELSGRDDLTLLERTDLAKIGDELKVEQMAGSDAVALGKLINADGLLFISKSAEGRQIRFTAVGLGYALFDDQIAPGVDLPPLAKSIAHLVEGYAPKLKLTPDQAVPISILNLRADYATADSTALERKLTLLLESRLASLPEYVVLERRHAWSLGFERSLAAAAKPLLQGAYVVDGTFSLPDRTSGDFTVQLRLRSPNGRQTGTAVPGSPGDLAALVEKIIIEIRKATGSSAALPEWQPQKEAREYLLEGIWGWQHRANQEALEALDSAELLGEKAPELFAVRDLALCALAGEDLTIRNELILLPTAPSAMPADQRTETILRAIQDAVRYRDEKANPLTPPSAPELQDAARYTDPAGTVISLASNILVLFDRDAPAQSGEIRDALRPLTRYDPLHGVLGPYYAYGHVASRDLFANEWPETLEEQLASYRLICSDPTQWLPMSFLNHGSGFCSRFLKSPEEQAAGFDQFVQSLKDIPGARLFYLLILSTSPDATQADTAFKAYLDELWKRRDQVAQTPGYPPQWGCARYLPAGVKIRNAQAGLPLLHYVLLHRNSFDHSDPPIDLLWQPEGWTDADAPLIWSEYQAFKQRIVEVWKAKGMNYENLNIYFAPYDNAFLKKFPNLALPPPSSTPSSGSLVATRFWYPWQSTSWPQGSCMVKILDVDEEGPWVSAYFNVSHQNGLFRVNFNDFSSQIITIPDNRLPENFKVTPEAVYLTWETHGHDNSGVGAHEIARYDLKTSEWATHALPDYFYGKLYSLEDSLYFFLNLKFAGNEMAIARYDWDQDKLTILSSTRRRPAQNQFDDRSGFPYAEMFSGPGHKPCVTTMEGTYYIQDQPGTWPEVFDGGFNNQSVTSLGKTLVVAPRGEATLLDPNQAGPVYLMAPPEPAFRKRALPGALPVKEIAPWAGQAIWDTPAIGHMWYTKVAFHGDRLFILDKPVVKGGAYDLTCYERGKGRNPRHIPLEFHLDDQARSALSQLPAGMPVTWNISQLEHPDTTIYPSGEVQFVATRQGLCIEPQNLGFWFVPYSDIDAYLSAHPPDQSAPGPTVASPSAVSTTNPKPPGGDTLDPGNPTSFR